MKILFMGTPDIALESLKNIYENGFDVCAVVTVPDRPAGRGNKIVSSPVKEFAVQNDLRVFQPEKISKNEEFLGEIRSIAPDLVVVVSYGVILPKSFLDIPKLGCINLHPSMLPKYRGAAPIQWAILNGDEKTGVTIMYLDQGMDSGDIIAQREVDIDPDETTGDLWSRLSTIGARMLLDTIKNIDAGVIERKAQPSDFTLAPMIDKEMAKIDWASKSANEIKNLVRGLNPFLGTYSFVDGKKIKLWKVQKYSNEEFSKEYPDSKIDDGEIAPGTVILSDAKKGLFIKANDGVISVLEIQGENAKRMGINDFLRGTQIPVGKVLQ